MVIERHEIEIELRFLVVRMLDVVRFSVYVDTAVAVIELNTRSG